jgi:hypothetical protein
MQKEKESGVIRRVRTALSQPFETSFDRSHLEPGSLGDKPMMQKP